MSHQKLSRVHFISGGATLAGTALLAACGVKSSQSVLPTAGTDVSRLSIAPTSRVTALGHQGLQLSSSASGRAVALHTSGGEFISSVVFGNSFARGTNRDGSVVMPTELPFQLDWYYLSNGAKFKYKKLKNNRHGILLVTPHRQKLLMHQEGGFLHFTDVHGHSKKLWMGRADRSGRLINPREDFNAMVDNHGTWTGDDDFAVREHAFSGLANLSTVKPDACAQIAKAGITPDYAVGDCGDNGGDDGGDGFGDTGDTGGGGSPGGPGNGGKGGGSTPQPRYTCDPGTSMSHECWVDLIGLAATVLSMPSAVLGGADICIVGGVFTLGASCLAALGLVALSSAALGAALAAYHNDNCPVPHGKQTC